MWGNKRIEWLERDSGPRGPESNVVQVTDAEGQNMLSSTLIFIPTL